MLPLPIIVSILATVFAGLVATVYSSIARRVDALESKLDALGQRLEVAKEMLAAEDRRQYEQLAELTRKAGEKWTGYDFRFRAAEGAVRDLQGFLARKHGFEGRGLPRDAEEPEEPA